MKNKRKAFWKNIKFKYKLTVTNENTLEEIVGIHDDHQDHQGDEQFVYSSFVQLLVDLSTHDPADDAAGNHQT